MKMIFQYEFYIRGYIIFYLNISSSAKRAA
nr:MAG TPA: hypothetical protein [Caudoviricetes sp.]